ncbi:AMP-binding protein [Streptomyces globisporus]|uniref:AMP-binding protein n=1 Tax=Streptomyces globisporus TaxID=1908 RepID=A0A927BNA6_STRGL|nr:AMP-binding protein [Streptomyces globisporus]
MTAPIDAGTSGAGAPHAVHGSLDCAPGEVVALVGEGGAAWADAYRDVREAGAVPLLVDPAAPAAEHARWLARGRRAAPAHPEPDALRRARRAERVRPPGDRRPGRRPGTVLLPSSGTTGSPKLVERSVDSLRAEGLRHVRWAGLNASDRVLLPLPLWHAYALGWLHAALEAGAELRAHPPTALGAVLRDIEHGATVLPLVPAVARLLAARAGRAPLTGTALRLAMVGAGVVDDELDDAFRAALGIGLARDYGSSETGSLFSAPAGAPSGRVGHPLAGIGFRILGDEGTARATTTNRANSRSASPANPAPATPRTAGAPPGRGGLPPGARAADPRPPGPRRPPGDRWVAPKRSRPSCAHTGTCWRPGSPECPAAPRPVPRHGCTPRW